MVWNMDKVCLHIMIVEMSMKVTGKMVTKMIEVDIHMLMVESKKVADKRSTTWSR